LFQDLEEEIPALAACLRRLQQLPEASLCPLSLEDGDRAAQCSDKGTGEQRDVPISAGSLCY